jgi:RNA 3'-terminal phosphate cyclase (ATP)
MPYSRVESKGSTMLKIDGSAGEGGGQILRTSLALSALTGQPFAIENIRAKRKKPGLLRQHLTAVRAAARVSHAQVEGDALGSLALTFRPGPVVPGVYEFAIGTAGSATLVLQTVLPALLTAAGPSRLTIEGGTHNPLAPPFDFLERAFLPLVNRMGPKVTARLERWGFFPAGGGRVAVEIEPAPALAPLTLVDPPAIRRKGARAVVANLPPTVAERELQVVHEGLGVSRRDLTAVTLDGVRGRGNVLSLEIESAFHCEVFTGFGQAGVSSEVVASEAVREARAYLAAGQPVGEYLADQLLVPLAMSGGGAFRTGPPSRHTLTNVDVVRRFLPVPLACREFADRAWEIRIGQ